MITWHTPEIDDLENFKNFIHPTGQLASDLSFGNVYLLRNKYGIEISFLNGFLLRHYNGTNGRLGYTFPMGNGNLKNVILELERDAELRNEPFSFCLLQEEQYHAIADLFPEKFSFTTTPNDSDYLYHSSDLATLYGKKYHKKKNHISQFQRLFPEYQILTLNSRNSVDAMKVAERWLSEHEPDPDLTLEYNVIQEALTNIEALELTGAILYVSDLPVAMTIASKISHVAYDIHFEKASQDFAEKGAYSVINNEFAKLITDYTWINREEDMGVLGLRQAKSSYQPKLLLNKYNAKTT